MVQSSFYEFLKAKKDGFAKTYSKGLIGLAKDKNEALITFVQVLNRPNYRSKRICLKGLDPEKNYRIEGEKEIYAGDTLLYAGIQIANLWGDFQSKLLHIVSC